MIIYLLIMFGILLLEIVTGSFIILGLITYIYRKIRSLIRGSRYIRKPDEFKYSLKYRPVNPGMELIVGYEDEYRDGNLKRYGITPEITGEETGTIFVVDSVTRNYYEIRKL